MQKKLACAFGLVVIGFIFSLLLHKSREKDEVIYFLVISHGTSGPEWIERLQSKGREVDDLAKAILLSDSFRATTGVTTKVAVLKSRAYKDQIGKDQSGHVSTGNLAFTSLQAEVACLVCDMLTGDDLYLLGVDCINVIHEPVMISDSPCILTIQRYGPKLELRGFELNFVSRMVWQFTNGLDWSDKMNSVQDTFALAAQ